MKNLLIAVHAKSKEVVTKMSGLMYLIEADALNNGAEIQIQSIGEDDFMTIYNMRYLKIYNSYHFVNIKDSRELLQIDRLQHNADVIISLADVPTLAINSLNGESFVYQFKLNVIPIND